MDTNKMRDISREQFEEVFQAKFPCIYAAAKAGESKAHGDMSVAWWGWQASREAVVVELPEPESPESYGVTQQDDPEQYEALESRMGAQYSAIFKCKRAIEAQGLKVRS